jgi:hypothetical protein
MDTKWFPGLWGGRPFEQSRYLFEAQSYFHAPGTHASTSFFFFQVARLTAFYTCATYGWAAERNHVGMSNVFSLARFEVCASALPP